MAMIWFESEAVEIINFISAVLGILLFQLGNIYIRNTMPLSMHTGPAVGPDTRETSPTLKLTTLQLKIHILFTLTIATTS